MPLLAFPIMVSFSFRFTYCSSLSPPPSLSCGQQSSSSKELPISGVGYWLESCRTHGVSKEVGGCELKIINRKTLLIYQRSWTGFSNWYNKWARDYSGVTVDKVCRYLIFVFNSKTSEGKDYSYEALNS